MTTTIREALDRVAELALEYQWLFDAAADQHYSVQPVPANEVRAADRKLADQHHAEWWAEVGWRDKALCATPTVRGLNLDFVDPRSHLVEDPTHLQRVLMVCGVCPVRDECHQWARRHRQTLGVWGGNEAHSRSKPEPGRKPGRPKGKR